MENQLIVTEVKLMASKEKAWDYYTNPTHIIHWNFASDDWQCPSVENDLRVGGHYKARMEAKDGSFGFEFELAYEEVIPNQYLSYTMLDGRKANVKFIELNGETEVIVSFEPENENPPEMQKGGWQAILDNFKKYTEAK